MVSAALMSVAQLVVRRIEALAMTDAQLNQLIAEIDDAGPDWNGFGEAEQRAPDATCRESTSGAFGDDRRTCRAVASTTTPVSSASARGSTR